MFDIVLSNQFKKDLKLIVKRGYKLEKLNKVVDKLASNIKLEDAEFSLNKMIEECLGTFPLQHQ